MQKDFYWSYGNPPIPQKQDFATCLMLPDIAELANSYEVDFGEVFTNKWPKFVSQFIRELSVLAALGLPAQSSLPVTDNFNRFCSDFIKFNLPFEEMTLSFESVYEMLVRRDEKNLMNEILDKHIILYGAELLYRLIQKGRR